jgi:hypothetical protein
MGSSLETVIPSDEVSLGKPTSQGSDERKRIEENVTPKILEIRQRIPEGTIRD